MPSEFCDEDAPKRVDRVKAAEIVRVRKKGVFVFQFLAMLHKAIRGYHTEIDNEFSDTNRFLLFCIPFVFHLIWIYRYYSNFFLSLSPTLTL